MNNKFRLCKVYDRNNAPLVNNDGSYNTSYPDYLKTVYGCNNQLPRQDYHLDTDTVQGGITLYQPNDTQNQAWPWYKTGLVIAGSVLATAVATAAIYVGIRAIEYAILEVAEQTFWQFLEDGIVKMIEGIATAGLSL